MSGLGLFSISVFDSADLKQRWPSFWSFEKKHASVMGNVSCKRFKKMHWM